VLLVEPAATVPAMTAATVPAMTAGTGGAHLLELARTAAALTP